jgi:hypothetical protein
MGLYTDKKTYRNMITGILNRKALIFLLFAAGCASPETKNTVQMAELDGFRQGTYGYDLAFLKLNRIETLELKDHSSGAALLLAPGYQGRVMTSTAGGNNGTGYGWINYQLIRSGKVNDQFNPVGGEERLWLGPEGGPYSIYFAPGEKQVFENWKVPAVLDTEPFEVRQSGQTAATFVKTTSLTNASGTKFSTGIERTVTLLPRDTLQTLFGADFSPAGLEVVAYQSDNMITNLGDEDWNSGNGLLSIWMLCMFSPSPATTVFIPYQEGPGGKIVKDDYFGKVPPDRLVTDSGVVYFKIDGELRSKIGIPAGRAVEMCGSYDSDRRILTLVQASVPPGPGRYVNSVWGDQDDPYDGDVINAYNDGPLDDGSIMGPFYEIETSSPGAELRPGESLTHTQRVVHVQGDHREQSLLVERLFGLDLDSISAKFKP